MTTTSLAFTNPIPSSAWSSHPALEFYAKYTKDVKENFRTLDPEKYYNARCKMYLTDHSLVEGSDNLWKFVSDLYSKFPKVTRDLITLIVVSDYENETHRLHLEIITSLHAAEDAQPTKIPQSFVYTLGKADEGKGTDGFQVCELRCYYDFSLIRMAHSLL